ncbi:BTB/POZ domain containing protein [Aphelenchoides bicaudatus]|nr:BTB/POZ domain containing protein [Aphelenchoides bicaudatus]
MGNRFSGYLWQKDSGTASDMSQRNDDSYGFFSRKRAVSDDDASSSSPDQPTRKVLKLDTAKYLHQTLFLDGKNSDVVICALGHEWALHKIYLEQCEYFRALFSGSWNDSSENRYKLDIVDERVTFEGLNSVFGSLYQNELVFELKDLSGILSASALFNLRACIERCDDVMLHSISADTVLEFWDLCQAYGCLRAREQIISYLTHYFWKLSQEDEFLGGISYDLLLLTISQPQLCVAEGEKDLYTAVKKWIYIQEENRPTSSVGNLHMYFVEKPQHYFYKYAPLLSHLRFQHMITSKKTLDTLKTEHIIGNELLSQVVNCNWETVLYNEEKQELEDVLSDEFFYKHCRRLGRHLTEEKCWRWAGLDFGLDLLFRCQLGMISMIRNVKRDIVPQSLSFRQEYKIHYRMILLDEKGNVVVDTKRRLETLQADQKRFVASYPANLKEFSIHLFYLNHVPGRTAESHWEGVLKENEEREKLMTPVVVTDEDYLETFDEAVQSRPYEFD